MILVVMILLWLILVNVCVYWSKIANIGTVYGYLLGRWPPTGEDPGPRHLCLVLLGRIGLILLFVILSGLAWRQRCSASLISLLLLPPGLAAAGFWLGEEKVLPGLTGIRVLWQCPDGYRFLAGRVAGRGPLCGSSLADLDLRRRGWLILAINHGASWSHFPKGQEVMARGDLLLIYGRPEHSLPGQA